MPNDLSSNFDYEPSVVCKSSQPNDRKVGICTEPLYRVPRIRRDSVFAAQQLMLPRMALDLLLNIQ